MNLRQVSQALGLQVLQRDWLSANHIVFAGDGNDDEEGGLGGRPRAPATVVDTGHARHAPLTLALVEHALAGQPLGRILNTHLHSDHCGGNLALQARWPAVRTLVPAASFDAAAQWDTARLSYQPTGQRCDRFRVDARLAPGDTPALGTTRWQVHAAPGHDPDAVLLFEPQTRTLISGDALWEERLAILFPEIDGQPGFGPARQTLALIERLGPRWVIPGHGAAFEDVDAALASSRGRLDAFERDPGRHLRHAARALAMFHMMEVRQQARSALETWLAETPIFIRMAATSSGGAARPGWAAELVASLLDDGLLANSQGELHLASGLPDPSIGTHPGSLPD